MGDETGSRSIPSIFRFFGWLLGGLSLLNLIRDVTPLELYGLVRDWVDAYTDFVDRVCGFLFGWIDWSWIRIDASENHIIVIAIILGATVGRARPRPGGSPFVNAMAWMGIMALLFAMLMLLLPSPWGVGLGLLSEALLLAMWTIFHDDRALRRAIIFELLVTLSAFGLILLVNHMFFRP